MINYNGVKCPYCNKTLQDSDDIAVCPECGTPHHRACYLEHGSCANESRHGESFEWTRPSTDISPKIADSGEKCPFCGELNDKGSVSCSSCGRPLRKKTLGDPQDAPVIRIDEQNAADKENGSFLLPVQNPPEAFEADEKIDDIPVSDWKTYIGKSSSYYLYFFKMQDTTGRKTAFTWSAAMFPPFYFLYRKMWLAAALSYIVELVCSLPSTILLLYSYYDISFGLSGAFLDTASSVCYIAYLVFRVLCGLFAVWLYRRHGAKKIKAMKAASLNSEEYSQRLRRSSGPSYVALLVVAGLFFSSFLITFLLSGAGSSLSSFINI